MKDVLVILRRVAKYGSREQNIRRAFRDEMFELVMLDGHTYSHTDCLDYAYKRDKNRHCIIITDRVFTPLKSSRVAKLVRKMTVDMKNGTICYLNRYKDQCQKMMTCYEDGKGTNFAITHAPHGEEAILYTPEGRNIAMGKKSMKNGKTLRCRSGSIGKSLTKAVKDGNIDAITSTPNMFEFDIDNATDNEEFETRCECAKIQPFAEQIDTNLSAYGLIAFIVALFIIIATAWALIRIGPKD